MSDERGKVADEARHAMDDHDEQRGQRQGDGQLGEHLAAKVGGEAEGPGGSLAANARGLAVLQRAYRLHRRRDADEVARDLQQADSRLE